MQSHWNGWHRTLKEEHSPIEIENRFTTLELSANSHEKRIDVHQVRLNLHERCLLGILGALYVLAQDRFPQIGALIRGLIAP